MSILSASTSYSSTAGTRKHVVSSCLCPPQVWAFHQQLRNKLFSLQQILSQPSDDSIGTKAPNVCKPGTVSFLFRFEIPLFRSCCSTRDPASTHLADALLPPSYELASDVFIASAKYQIRAVVERPGRMRRNITTTSSFVFWPLHPPDLRFTGEATRVKLTDYLPLLRSMVGPETPRSNGTLHLPPYSPPITVNITVPMARVIRPGDHVDLTLEVYIPEEIRRSFGQSWLESLTIQLRTTTLGSVAGQVRSHTGYIQVFSLQGFLPLAGELARVSSDLWHGHVYPEMLPSFESCGVRRSYELELIATIRMGREEIVHVGIDGR